MEPEAIADKLRVLPAPLSDVVDVIVPVYRGLDDTRCCVESVLSSAVNTPFRLVLINDCSPEAAVIAPAAVY